MFKHTRSAVTLLAASIKLSMLNGLDNILRRNAAKANLHLRAAIAEDRKKHATPGAFGRPITDARPCPAGIARRIANSGKVRGY
jgi:hypothetical protein